MERYLPLLYDLLAAAAVVLMARKGVKRGFARAAVSFLGFFAASALAGVVSRAAAPVLFGQFIRPALMDKAASAAAEFWEGGRWTELAEGFLEELPAGAANILSFGGLDLSAVQELAAETGAQAARELVDRVFAGPCVAMLSSILFILVFGISMYGVKKLAYSLRLVNRIPLVGPVNAVLGGAVGALEGILTVYICVLLLLLMMVLTGDGLPFFDRETVGKTWFLRYFFRYAPFGVLII